MTTITTSRNRHRESTIIEDFHYNVDTKVLIVTFKTGKATRYKFTNVEESLFEEVAEAASIGSAFISKIASNPKFKYEIIK